MAPPLLLRNKRPKLHAMGGIVLKYSRLRLSIISTVALIALLSSVTFGAQNPAPTDKKQNSSANAKTPPTDPPVQPLRGYRVGVDDELMISVWHEPEMSQAVVVRPDGMITLPLINDIRVLDLTTEELQATLTEKLKAVVNDPQVTVTVKAIKSLRVFLVGAVGKQGMYPLSSGLTALELLAEGGGLGAFAKSGSIYILRNQNGKQVRIPFDYKKALKGKGDNPVLQPGDMIVVP